MTVNESLFPDLVQTGYRLTSPPDPVYNCIAYAACNFVLSVEVISWSSKDNCRAVLRVAGKEDLFASSAELVVLCLLGNELAFPERRSNLACEITFPRVLGYRYDLGDEQLTAKFTNDSKLALSTAEIPTKTENARSSAKPASTL